MGDITRLSVFDTRENLLVYILREKKLRKQHEKGQGRKKEERKEGKQEKEERNVLEGSLPIFLRFDFLFFLFLV